MPSKYAETAHQIALEVHAYLVRSLDLPTPFRSTDPLSGERYGILTPQDLSSGEMPSELYLNCTFFASGGFSDYWQACQWAIGMGMNLDSLLPQVGRHINRRKIFTAIERSGNISTGNPRAPLQQPQGQQSHIWIVDVVCPCRIKLLVFKDPVLGHL